MQKYFKFLIKGIVNATGIDRTTVFGEEVPSLHHLYIEGENQKCFFLHAEVDMSTGVPVAYIAVDEDPSYYGSLSDWAKNGIPQKHRANPETGE